MVDINASPPKKPSQSTTTTNRALLLSIAALILAATTSAFTWLGLQQSYHNAHAMNDYIRHSPLQTQIATLQSQLNKARTERQRLEKKLTQLTATQLKSKNQRAFIEASYLIHLANLKLIISRDNIAALQLLELAQSQLQLIKDTNIAPLKQLVATNINQLKNTYKVNIASLLKRLQALSQAIANLPILPNIKPTKDDDNNTTLSSQQSTWYQKLRQASLSQLKQLVIIRHNQQPIKPLLLPEQVIFLKEKAQLNISAAEWAVIYYNVAVYQQRLLNTKKLLQLHYTNQKIIADVINTIDVLLKENIAPTSPNLLHTLKVLHNVAIPTVSQP